jgi:putative hydroxymethylpyrimidine transport system permease protein
MKLARGMVVILGLLALWQLLVFLLKLPPYILPTPIQVFITLYQQAPLIAAQTLPTIIETLLGLVLGALLGSFMAFSMAIMQPVRLWLMPVLVISQALPTFAIAPLLVIWLGYGIASKIAITILMLFFPVASAFFDGLCHVPQGWLDLAYIMNASRWQILWRIRIPAALPSLATGLRVATVAAPIGAVIGEWVGSSSGLGFLMLNANARMQIDLMFSALLVLIAFSLALYFSVDYLLRVIIPWQKNNS